MPATVTSSFRISNAKEFVNSFEEAENGGRADVNGKSYVYLFIGKSLDWSKTHAGYSDSNVPTPDGDVQGNSYEPWHDMIAAERIIANTDISFGAQRYDWVPGTTYTAYDDQQPSITKGLSAFYVYESGSGDVFKCLDNNGGAESTVLPTRPISDSTIHIPFTKSDGYRWKYMFTIPAGQSKFLTTNYIPVRTLNVHSEITGGADGPPTGYGSQSLVQERANNGAIETYEISSGGQGFTRHSGGLTASQRKTEPSAAANTTFFRLTSAASPTADFYNGAAIFLSNTTYQKGIGIIKDYSGSVNEFTDGTGAQLGAYGVILYGTVVEGDGSLAAEFAPIASGNEDYIIGPRLDVLGDGNNANAYAICSGGGIIQVNTWNAGNNYTTSNVVVVPGPGESPGGAQIRGVLSPPGGHGSDPVAELNAYNVIISKSLSGAGTGNSFPISNEYRTVGLLRNSYLKEGYAGPGSGVTGSTLEARSGAVGVDGKNWYANTSTIRQTTWVVANTKFPQPTGFKGSTDWTPKADDEVKGRKSGVTARVIEYNTQGNSIIMLGNISAANSGSTTFLSDEQIYKLQDQDGTPSDGNEWITANGNFVDAGGTPLAPAADIAEDPDFPHLYAPELQPQTGNILYLENRAPITRAPDQAEDIKIVVEF
jgi:hypothetical protein